MDEVYELEWTFEPSDFFEESFEFQSRFGTFYLTKGTVKIHVSPEQYPSDNSRRMEIHKALENIFSAKLMDMHKPYRLKEPGVARLHQDGRRDAWAFTEAATLSISLGQMDAKVLDSAGNATHDSQRDRRDRVIAFAVRCAQYSDDPVLSALLKSYSNAVLDPDNEFFHLYEIRDALQKYFGSKKEAQTAIYISETTWDDFDNITNDRNISQGRHRGKGLGVHRQAKPEELSKVRTIAKSMIDGYLMHLDGKVNTQS